MSNIKKIPKLFTPIIIDESEKPKHNLFQKYSKVLITVIILVGILLLYVMVVSLVSHPIYAISDDYFANENPVDFEDKLR